MIAMRLSFRPRRHCRWFLWPYLLLLLMGGAPGTPWADPPDIYQAAVRVQGQGMDQRNDGVARALDQVLVKVTGSRAAASRGEAAALRAQAPSLVQQYRYENLPQAADGADAAADRMLVVRFDPVALNQAVRDQGLPVWGGVRPSVLLWLGLDEGGQRRFYQAETDGELTAALDQVAAQRGMGFLTPLLDLEDLTRLQASDLWGGFDERLRDASERYGPDLVLAGRLTARRGAWQGDWRLLQRERVEEWQSRGAGAAAALEAGLDEAVERLASRFAPLASQTDMASVVVQVVGMDGLGDFVRTERLLRGLDVVERSHLARVLPDRVLFRLQVRGGREALSRAAGLSRNLLPEPAASADAAGGVPEGLLPDLSFRYMP